MHGHKVLMSIPQYGFLDIGTNVQMLKSKQKSGQRNMISILARVGNAILLGLDIHKTLTFMF